MPVGQKLLRIIHRDVLEAYKQTPTIMRDLKKGLTFLLEDVSRVTLEQIGASEEQKTKPNLGLFRDQLDLDLLERVMSIDKSLTSSKKSITLVLNKVARVFVEADRTMPSLSKDPIYDIPYLASLTRKRVNAINNARVVIP